jgi:SpoVK/Ycf46/Vps4 family AAA+-type ATPase
MRLHIKIPLPDEEARKDILNLHLSKYNIKLDQILKDTSGFSGSDLFELCKLAGLEAISENRIDDINLNDLNIALKQLSVSSS